MPYSVKGKCVYKKDTGKKVGCTKGSVKDYLSALYSNVDEDIDASEAYGDKNSLETLFSGKRDIAYTQVEKYEAKRYRKDYPDIQFYWPFLENPELANEYRSTLKGPDSFKDYYTQTNCIAFRNNKEGKYRFRELYNTLKRNQGFLPDQNKFTTMKTGRLLGYNKDSVNSYIKKIYGENKVEKIRKIIREEVKQVLKEGSIHNVSLWALRESDDGKFSGISPSVYIEAKDRDEAEKFANEYTNGQFIQWPRFYDLRAIFIKIYGK